MTAPQLGDGCRVWHFVHISAGARIGRGCSFGQNVYVGNDVVIGDNVKIQNNVSVYDAVTLEDDVFCGPSMVFTNVLQPARRGGAQERVPAHPGRRGATLGANCTIVCGTTIGPYAFVGAGAVVTPRRARLRADGGRAGAAGIGWMSRHGERSPCRCSGDGRGACPHTGERYWIVHCDPAKSCASSCMDSSTSRPSTPR
jgi:UDP-2-acetamido-3-amino-2,3-dideoxy-glucuronate N-acetyltransferase